MAAWSLLLSLRKKFLSKLLARVPITSIQGGTMEMRDEVLSSVDAQNMDTRGYQVYSMLNSTEDKISRI